MPAPMQGPLGQYGIARSLVQTPGWKALEAEEGGMMPTGGGGSRGSVRFGGGGGFDPNQYRGRIGADTTNLPPSLRGLYQNSAPSLAAIQSSYNANMATGRYTHEEAMKIINDQADRDAKFWAEGFAKDPFFSKTLYDNSQKMLGTNQAAKQVLYDRATKKNRYGQTVNDQLRASAGVFDAPRKGAMPGGRTSNWSPKITKAAAPLNPRTGRTFSSAGHW